MGTQTTTLIVMLNFEGSDSSISPPYILNKKHNDWNPFFFCFSKYNNNYNGGL